jgi:cytochrome c oxidase cbb3-type subunit 2
MDKDIQHRIPAHPPTPQGFAHQEPQRHILMTPAMAAIGGMVAFFTIVFSVVILPTTTYKPPESHNWLPLSDAAFRGRGVYLSNGCVYCHSGFSRPQDVYNGIYYLYPRVSEPGDYNGISQSPNVFGSERTGPDLSQEGGNHPDGWHKAHYDNPRNTMPLSIMPKFNFLSEDQLNDLIAFNQTAGGKEAVLRYAAVTVGNKLMRINGGNLDPGQAFPELVQQLKQQGSFQADGQPSDKSPSGLPWKLVWHMNSFERSYWLTLDPLPVTQANLLRGKDIFLKRCAGCHGAQGDGKGPAAQFLTPTPFDFTDPMQFNWAGGSDGQFYHRILTAGPGTAMENFGTRLSVEDIWRVVLFLRTIPNGGLKQPLVTVDMYTSWEPPQPMLNYLDNHPIQEAPQLTGTAQDPFMVAAQWLAPGMAPKDEIIVGGKLPMTLERLKGLIQSSYTSMVEQAYNDAQARGEELPEQEQIMSTQGLQFHAP